MDSSGEFVLCDDEKDAEYRVIHFDGVEKLHDIELYHCNRVVTSRYTFYNFVPKILFFEFSKLANAYFLVISIMQTIKPISNTGGFPASLPALSIIVCIDMFFAALEDYRRHVSDGAANRKKCLKLEDTFKQVQWDQLLVGDIVKLENRDGIPADVVILATEEPDVDNPSGICYVETKSLDGETNLKLRQGVECLYTKIRSEQDLGEIRGKIVCEQPNNCIHRFCGTIKLEDGTEEVISTSNMLLRGSTLRNTDYIYAMVINTGPDTKIMQTASSSPIKWSNMETRLNRQILNICVLVFALCLFGAVAQLIWNKISLSNFEDAGAWYIHDPNSLAITSPVGHFFVSLLYYFLLLNSFIPVSLYVSMTSVKFMQSYFMNGDINMYHEESDTPCSVRSMSLNEELGQIDYIFSDKTGTLTCNVMDFRKCSIGGIAYGRGTTEIGLAAQRRMGMKVVNDESSDDTSGVVVAPFVNFDDPELLRVMGKILSMNTTATDELQRQRILKFWEHLAICHTVMPEVINAKTGEIRLSASSPDEQALVAAAASFGYSFVGRKPGVAQVKLDHASETVSYEILDILEFNSTRKRMSVIVKTPKGKIVLLCKGADTVIYARLKDSNDREVVQLRQDTLEHMETFASEGLRTLVIASTEIDLDFYNQWAPKYHSALNDMTQVDLRRAGESNSIDQMMEQVEENLEILGVTAIEDRLQAGVPKAIAQLAEANIKIWMLTGDKEETAINIGFACELLTQDIQRLVISAETHDNSIRIIESLDAALNTIDEGDHGLIIDGEALELALTHCPIKLLNFARECKAVIACRVSPAQKAELVRLVRENICHARTLAIGDGANDVSMIQEAHIGIGISGQEGMQAANSSDYSIAQFRFLNRLLLVHGRWNYIRMAKLILYIFYKNVVMNLTQYWYMVYTGFSGQKIFLEWGLQGYNLLFTALPIILVGIFEQDVPYELAENFPRLYFVGQQNKRFNTRVLWTWISSCMWESVVISFGTIHGLKLLNTSGVNAPMWVYGCAAFTIVVLVVNLKLALHQFLWYRVHFVVYFLSVALWIAAAAFISYGKTDFAIYWNGVFGECFGGVGYWLLMPLLVFVSLSRDVFWKGYTRAFRTTYRHLAQEVSAFGLIDHANELLTWPPPSRIPVHDGKYKDLEDATEKTPSKVQKIFKNATAAARRPFRQKLSSGEAHRGFSFSYDAESIMAQAVMATEKYRNIGKTFRRHGSRGSLAFEEANTHQNRHSSVDIRRYVKHNMPGNSHLPDSTPSYRASTTDILNFAPSDEKRDSLTGIHMVRRCSQPKL